MLEQCNLQTGEEDSFESEGNNYRILYARPRFITANRRRAVRPENTEVAEVSTPHTPRNVGKKAVGTSEEESKWIVNG